MQEQAMMWGYGHDWSMMSGWGGAWWGPFGMIIWPLLIVAVIAGMVWIFVRSTSRAVAAHPSARSPGLETLEQRYARGEINRDEYLQKKNDIAD